MAYVEDRLLKWLTNILIVLGVLLILTLPIAIIGGADKHNEFKAACAKLHGVTVHNGREYVCLR